MKKYILALALGTASILGCTKKPEIPKEEICKDLVQSATQNSKNEQAKSDSATKAVLINNYGDTIKTLRKTIWKLKKEKMDWENSAYNPADHPKDDWYKNQLPRRESD